MKHLLFYIAFFSSLLLFSQSDKKVVQYDNSSIQPKSFDAKKIESYKNNDDFVYELKPREPTWIENAINWFKRVVKSILSYFFDDIAPAVGFLLHLLRILPYVIAAIVLFLIIKFFVKVHVRSIIDGKSATPIVNLSEDEELIKDKDLPKLIDKAIADGNYRLAVRYYYLLILRKLSEKELISWQQEKTNEDYIKELTSSKLHSNFKDITYLYDYVWYGNFLINKEKFIQSEVQLQNFIKTI